MQVLTWIRSTLQHKRYKYTLLSVIATIITLRVIYNVAPDEFHRIPFILHNDYLSHLRAPNALFGKTTYSIPGPINRIVNRMGSKSYLHLIVPATSSNEGLCKMLLSIAALGYPAPIFVNWGEVEDADPYVQHVAKVGGILRYLNTLPKSRADDLVLIVDGYDAWFQLRPDVIISRYYEVIEAENNRLEQKFGKNLLEAHKIRQSIVFGPDKICWPEDQRRAAYWAVPESTLPRYAFGPDTDSGRWREHNRPRWLNSGTIIGPIRDVRKLLEATEKRIKENRDPEIVSDQYHFANIFGDQEFARLSLLKALPEHGRKIWQADDYEGRGHVEEITLEFPELDREAENEFHITIDYESRLFQTVAYYWKWLSWYAYDGSTHAGQLATNDNRTLLDNGFNGQTHFTIPQDIMASPPPFSGTLNEHAPIVQGKDPSKDPQPSGLQIPSSIAWTDLMLGTNIISRQVFPLLHFTPPKDYLETWWHNMWFFPYGEAIIKNAAAAALATRPLIVTADGRVWWNWVIDDNDEILPEFRVGGGFDVGGAWHSWHRLCKEHEGVVFHNERKPERPRQEPDN